jgi:hypothetical protein
MIHAKTPIMGWLTRRREAKQASLVETLATALGKALGQVFEAQSKQIESSSRFLDQLQDLSARKAAQVMGSKGGRVTQQRKKLARKAAESPSPCALCQDPYRRGVTLQMIEFHRLHEESGRPSPEDNAVAQGLLTNGNGDAPEQNG